MIIAPILARLFSKKNVIFLIIVLAIALRLCSLGSIPGSLNIDETTIGYNSYSFLLTGKDEYGATMPLAYKSFGDWKLSGYPFASMLPIKLFGLNAFAVRLPSALAGIAQVILMYFIGRLLFKRYSIALLATLFYAISPWSIYFSRIAYEANLATAFLLAGIYTFLVGIVHKRSGLFIFTAIFFGLTVFIYHSYIISMPLFMIALIIIYRQQLPRNKLTYCAVIIFFLLISLSLYAVSKQSIAKFSNLSVFNSPNIVYNRTDIFRTDHAPDIPILSRLIYNKFAASFYQSAQNYLATFSPQFLFDTGGISLMGSLGYFGLFYIVDALFLLTGVIAFIFQREKWLPFFIAWVAIAAIPSAITVDAPSSTRLIMILPIFILISAYGASSLLTFLRKQRFGILLGGFIVAVFLWNIFLFLDGYFIHMNYVRAIFQHYGYQQAVKLANKYPSYRVVMVGPDNFPYVSFLFYNQYDPYKFRQEVEYYPNDGNQFILVKKFDRYEFPKTLNYNKLAPNTLYFDRSKPNKQILTQLKTSGTIKTPNGTVIFWYFIK